MSKGKSRFTESDLLAMGHEPDGKGGYKPKKQQVGNPEKQNKQIYLKKKTRRITIMTSYRKMEDLNKLQEINPFYVDSIMISTEDHGMCIPRDSNFIVFGNGKIFENADNNPEKLKDIKIWVQCEDHQVNNVFKSLFSTSENPNPSKKSAYRNSRSVSFLMSKILKYSDFCGGDMRALILEDPFYIVDKSADKIIVSHSEPLVED